MTLSSASKISLAWVGANLVVAGAFLYVASFFWIEPELADIPGASAGSPILWTLLALPIIAFVTLCNLGTLVWCAVRTKRVPWPFNWISWFVLVIWVAAIYLDNSRHGA